MKHSGIDPEICNYYYRPNASPLQANTIDVTGGDIDCQLSTVNCRGGRVYQIADLKHGWLVKPAPTSQLSTIDCRGGRVYQIADLKNGWLVKPAPTSQLSTVNYQLFTNVFFSAICDRPQPAVN